MKWSNIFNKNLIFTWKGISEDGLKIEGENEAADKKALFSILLKKNITVLDCKPKPQSTQFYSRRKLNAKQIATFTEQLSDLLLAGIPLSDTLSIIENSTKHPALKKITQKLNHKITNGFSFSSALSKFPHLFDSVYCTLTQAGEQSGALDAMLKQLALYQERSINLKMKIKKALFYPITVLITLIAVSAGLLIFVIPQFQNVFSSFGAKLPSFTRGVIQISNILRSSQAKVFALTLALVIMYFSKPKYRSQIGKYADGLFLKIPLLKTLIIETTTTRWAHVLSTLLEAGLPITDALSTANNTITHHALRRKMKPILKKIEAGEALHEALKSVKEFPHEYLQMIAVGENTGQLGSMLGKINKRQQAQLDHRLDHLSQWIEPVMMLLLAVLVGGLIIAMYLPIFQMGSVI